MKLCYCRQRCHRSGLCVDYQMVSALEFVSVLACKWYFNVEHNNFISKKLSYKYLGCLVLIPPYKACNLQVAHDYQSGLKRVFCFLEFSQQWIIQPVTVQRGISQWQGTGGWLGKMENCDYMIWLNGIKFKLRGFFSACVRLQRRRPMTREAGREKGTSMTAIVRVSPELLTHQSVDHWIMQLSLSLTVVGLCWLWWLGLTPQMNCNEQKLQYLGSLSFLLCPASEWDCSVDFRTDLFLFACYRKRERT